MAQAESVNGSNEKPPGLVQPQFIKSAIQFTRTFLTEGDARDTSRSTDIPRGFARGC